MKFFKKIDLLIVALILALSAAAFFIIRASRSGGDTALVYVDGVLTAELPLEDDTLITLDNGMSIAVQNGAVRVVSSDCPDKICVNSGAISTAPQSIVCVPNGVVIRINGEDDVDVVA